MKNHDSSSKFVGDASDMAAKVKGRRKLDTKMFLNACLVKRGVLKVYNTGNGFGVLWMEDYVCGFRGVKYSLGIASPFGTGVQVSSDGSSVVCYGGCAR